MVKNAKFACRRLILTFFAMCWLAPSQVPAEEDRTYGRTAIIESAPPSDFLPTVALLDNGALECSSADAYSIIQSYSQGMNGIVSTDKTVMAGRMRLEASLDCRTNEKEQIVDVLMIDDVLLSGHPSDKRTVARVRMESGVECYVDAGGLEF